MKVAICAALDLNAAGGVETHIRCLAQAMRRQGVHIDLYDSGGLFSPATSGSPLPIQGYDILHTHGCALNTSIWRSLWRRPPHQRHIHTLHGISLKYLLACRSWLNWRCYWATFVEAVAARMAHQVIAVSTDVLHSAQRGFGIPSARTIFIGNGYVSSRGTAEKTAARANLNLPEDQVIVLFVGRGEDRVKGTQAIQKSLDQLVRESRPVCLLAVPGSGFENKPWIYKTGPIQHERIFSYYSVADIMVNASLNEGMPLTVLEAMATNLPVIASPVGGLMDLIQNEQNGLLLRPDRSNLTEQLRRLIDAPALRSELGRAAGQSVKEMAWDHIAKKTLGVYEVALATGRQKNYELGIQNSK